MTKDGILGLLCLIVVVAELMTSFTIPTLHWVEFMLLLTALLGGE